jgi:hypothetical protein
MAYLLRDDLKRYLGIAVADTSEDALLDDLLADAQARIDVYCDRTFEADSDEARTFRAVESVVGSLLMMNDEICQVAGVTNGDAAGTLIGGGAYTLQPLSGPPYTAIELHDDAGVRWEGDIQVIGRWAYSVNAPQGIVAATRSWASWLYREYDATTKERSRMRNEMPSYVAGLLDQYRRIRG